MNRKRKLPPVAAQYQGYRIRGTKGKYWIYTGKKPYVDKYFATVDEAINLLKP